ncbi:MAG TPA: ferredoxin family protein [Bacillota bacterium]|nr:ferredoxin family protein [Bacillota bacterium]
MSEDTWNGIPRQEVPWFPTIDQAKCTQCGTCVDFCSQGTYIRDEKNNPVVKNPYNCVVGCSGCKPQCPAEALSFPPLSVLGALLEAKK